MECHCEWSEGKGRKVRIENPLFLLFLAVESWCGVVRAQRQQTVPRVVEPPAAGFERQSDSHEAYSLRCQGMTTAANGPLKGHTQQAQPLPPY